MKPNLLKKMIALALICAVAASNPAAVMADTGTGQTRTSADTEGRISEEAIDAAVLIDAAEDEELVGSSECPFTLEQFTAMMDGFVYMEAESEEIIFMGDDGWIYKIRNGTGSASPYLQNKFTYDASTGVCRSSVGECYQIRGGKVVKAYHEDYPDQVYLPYATMTPDELTARLADEYVGEYNDTEHRLAKTSDSVLTLTAGNRTTVYNLDEWEIFEANGCIMQKRYDGGYTVKYVIADGSINEIFKETYFENEWHVYAVSSVTPVENLDLKGMMDGYAYMSADEYRIYVGYDKRIHRSKNEDREIISESASWTYDSATGIYRSDMGMCFRADNDKIAEIFFEDDPNNIYYPYPVISKQELIPMFADSYSGEYNGKTTTVHQEYGDIRVGGDTPSYAIDLSYECKLFRTENCVIQVMDTAGFSVKYILNGDKISEIYLERNTGKDWDVYAVHYVTVEKTVGGTVTADRKTAKAGDTVSVTATPNANYTLMSLAYNDTEIDLADPSYSFMMPDEDVIIYSYFEADASVVRSGICGDNLTWTLVQGVLTVSGTGDMYDMTDYEAVSIAGIAPWNDCKDEIRKVVLEEGVTSAGRCAFLDCINIREVVIPNSVTKIGRRAFMRCSSLQEITIPGSVEEIEDTVFASCTSLTKAVVEEGIEALSSGMFGSCSSLTDVSLPDSLTDLRNAFCGCTSLKSITIPENVNKLGYAFQDCTSLESIVIPAGVTTLDGSFSRCTSLKSITLPNTITQIERYALDGCASLTSIAIPDSVTIIYDYAFRGCTGLREIKLPESVKTIDDHAFTGCTALETIDISASVNTIDKDAFIGCTSVTDVYIRGIDYGSYTFDDESAVNDLNLPSGTILHVPSCVDLAALTAEKDGAIYYWHAADSGSVVNDILGDTPHTVESSTSIGGIVSVDKETALEGELVTLTITPHDGYEFDQVNYNGTVITPVQDVYRFVMPDRDVLVTAEFAEHRGTCGNSAYWRLLDGVLTIYGSGSMTQYSRSARAPWYDYRDEIRSLVVERGVRSVGAYALYGCTYLESVRLPIGLSTIGDYAFYECAALADIQFKDGVDDTYISLGRYAFSKCTSLKNVVLSDYTRSIPAYCFYGCTSLESVSFTNTVSILSNAFSGCTSLQSITIPLGQAYIYSDAFYNCTSVKNVYIKEQDYSNFSFDTQGTLNDFNTPSGTTIHVPAQVNLDALTEETGKAVYYWYKANRNSVVNDIEGRISYPIEITQTSGGTITADKNAAQAGETVTLTVQADNGYIAKAPTLNYTYVDVNKISENQYAFTMPQGDVAITAKWGNGEPAFTTKSLILSGNIGVNFFMDLPEIDGVDYTASYMEFTVGSNEEKKVQVPFDPTHMNPGKTYYGFPAYVNSLQMSDTITAVYHYTQDGVEKTKETTYTVEQYLVDAKGRFGDLLDGLLQSLYDYGYYSQVYLSNENNWVIGTDHAAMTLMDPTVFTAEDKETAKSALQDMAGRKDLQETDIASTSCSLKLDYATSISVYFKPASGYTGKFIVTLAGDRISAKKQTDGRYKVTIPNIGANKLGERYEFSVETESGTSTVSVTALTYAYACLNSDKSNAPRDNAMIALYRYYKAASDYIG